MTDLAVEYVDLKSILPYARNARTHSAEQIAALGGSLKEFGWTVPLLVDEKGVLIAGHGRALAARQIGMTTVPVIRRSDLTPTQVKAYRLVDNQLATQSGWNPDLLRLEAKDLTLAGFDMPLLGFGEALEGLLAPPAPEPNDGNGDPDDVPEPPKEPRSRPGDLWLCGEHRLLCGDATNALHLDRLMNGERADMIFTDPPYGVSFVGIKGSMYAGGKRSGRDSNAPIENDDLRGVDLTNLFRDALSLGVAHLNPSAPIYVFFAINRSAETLPAISACGLTVRNWLIWDKGNVGFHAMGAQYKPNYEAFLYCHVTGESPTWHGTPFGDIAASA